MDFGCLKFMLILALVERIRSLPLGCPYNGTSYKEGESVRTEEPCLSCACRKGALECSLRVCAEYRPNVLPPACFLVHKPNDCCPQLFCEEKHRPGGVELRTGFKLETRLHGNDCVINGSVYAEGSAVASSRVCEYCYCVEGEMKCIKPRCLQSFEGCKAVYEKSSCCPTHYDCRDVDLDYLTAQIKNFAKIHPAVSPDSLRSFSSTDLNSEEVYFNAKDTASIGLIKTEEVSTDESPKTTSEEMNTEETTGEPEKESTVSSAKDWITTIGFQTRTENFEEESTKVAVTESTTFEAEKDVNVSSTFAVMESQKEAGLVQTRSKVDFRGGIESSIKNSGNSSLLDVNDYDSYDYSEPRLPPSLPNLVIYPFVAADAVVKNENANVPATFEKLGVERIDSHPAFYKDYFSPPLKTEGGFMPKEPAKAEEPFYEYGYFSRQQMEPPSASLKEYSGTQIQANALPVRLSANCVSDGRELQHREILLTSRDCMTCTCQHGAVVCQNLGCPQSVPETIILENQKESGNVLENRSNVGLSDRFGQTWRPDTETPPALILKQESMEFNGSHPTKKPVTVTYKNFVVDFYPNYLITTTRDHFKLQSIENLGQKTSEKDFQHSTQNSQTQSTIVPLTTTIISPVNFFDEVDTSISEKATEEIPTKESTETIITTTSETYFFEELVKSFLPKEETSERATSAAAAKRKYSSKIKGEIIATIKPKEEIKKKTIPEVAKVNSTADIYSRLNSIMKAEGVTEKTENHNFTLKSLKKDDLKQLSKIPVEQLPMSDTKNEKVEFSESMAEAHQPSENRKGSAETRESGNMGSATKPNAGALLKLAGCNIYGMMYRVGKVITELSGPCLECLCTQMGVQCRPLKC